MPLYPNGGGGANDRFVTSAPSPTTITFDVSTGNRQVATLTVDNPLALTGDTAQPIFTIVLNTGTGGHAPVWWDGITWMTDSSHTAPTVSVGANKRDIFSFVRLGANDYAGFVLAQAIALPVVPTVPDAPTIGTATAGNASATVTWTAPASNGGSAITGYVVTPYVGATAQTATTVGNVTSTTITGLTNSTAYTFKVAAINTIGTGAQSAASNSVTPAVATVPGAPTAVVGTPGDTTASIAFTAPASDGGSAITGYTATLSPGGATFSASSSPIAATGLTNGTAYTATVHATNAEGNSTESSASAAFTPAVVTPASFTTKLWLKPDAESFTDGATATTTTDRSSSGNNMTGVGSGSIPGGAVMKTGIIDSKAVFRFDGSHNQFYFIGTYPGSVNVSTATDNYVGFAVCKITDVTVARAIFALGALELDPSSITTADKIGSVLIGTAVMDSTTSAPAGFAILVVQRKAGTAKLYLNGGTAIAASTTAPAAVTGPASVGMAASGAARPFTGDMGEIFFIEGALTAAEVNSLGAYLVSAARYPSLSWTNIT